MRLFAFMLPAVLAVGLGAQTRSDRLARLAAGALRRAVAELRRADRLEAQAQRLPEGSRRWAALMEGARERLQIAYGALHKYRRAALGASLAATLRGRLTEVRGRLVAALTTLYGVYRGRGLRTAAARVLAALRRVDPGRARALGGVAKGGGVRPLGRGGEGRRRGGVIRPGRGGRLTGAQLRRWLRRLQRRLPGVGRTPRPLPRPVPRPRR